MCVCDTNSSENCDSRQDESYYTPEVEDIRPPDPITDCFQTLDGPPPLFANDRVSLPPSQQEPTKSSDVASYHNNNSDDLRGLLCGATISSSADLIPNDTAANPARDADVSDSALDADSSTTNPLSRSQFPPKGQYLKTEDEETFEISLQISTESVFTDEQQSHDPPPRLVGAEPLAPSSEVIADPIVSSSSSSLMPLPLSPQETEGFDEMKSLQAITFKGADFAEDMVLSTDLQGVNTTPFVKEELKERIKSRRQKKGLPLPRVEEDTPKPDILTKEEEEKRRIRRERNRIAAAKCRRKKKAKAMERRKASELILEQNIALLDEMEDLMKEKAKLQRMLREHLRVCNKREIIHLEVPQVTSVRINTTLSISDSDSMEDDAGGPLILDAESSDSESIDLTEDVGDQLMESSLLSVLHEDDSNLSDTSDHLLQALGLLGSMEDTYPTFPSTSGFFPQ